MESRSEISYPKLRDILGDEKLQRVAGLVIQIPKKPNEDHVLSSFIGVESAQKLSQLAGGKLFYFPKFPNGKRGFVAERNQRIFADRLAGLSYTELARKYLLSITRLKKIIYEKRVVKK